jgi:hypothetical protein
VRRLGVSSWVRCTQLGLSAAPTVAIASVAVPAAGLGAGSNVLGATTLGADCVALLPATTLLGGAAALTAAPVSVAVHVPLLNATSGACLEPCPL